MKKWWLFALLLLVGCAPLGSDGNKNDGDQGDGMMAAQRVQLTSKDGLQIVGNYYGAPGESAVVLLHMMRRSKADWDGFAQRLQREGIASIAIDLRGHGESAGDLGAFQDQDFKNMKFDAQAAVSFLRTNGKAKIMVMGASIGANTALVAADEDRDIMGAVLLAPGADYLGVVTLDVARRFERPILVVLSKDDVYYETGQEVWKAMTGAQKVLKVYEKGGHGTWLFGTTDLEDVLVDWLEKIW